MSWHVLGSFANRIRFSIPEGRRLPDEAWRRRHLGILVLLWLHVLGIAFWAALQDFSVEHILLDAGVVAGAALLAGWARLPRKLQASLAAFGLVSSSAVMVHLSGGYIEFHFHFFVMVGLMALYQDWVPFLLAIVFVVIHHGTVGVLNPASVYNHAGAWASPWMWAGIHGAFITAMSAVSLIGWRLNEGLHARFESILNSVGEGIVGVDLQGHTTFVNTATLKMGGWQASELIGQPLHATLQRSASPEGDEVFWRKDGTYFPIECVRTPVLEHGEVVGTVLVVKDITERKRAERSLRLSEERFRTLTTLAPAGIFRTDAAGRCVYANERFRQLTGFTPEAMADEGWTSAIHPDDRARAVAAWDTAAQAGSEFSIECRVQTSKDEVAWVSGRAIALRNERGQVVGHMGTLTDITELKEAEAALRRSETQLRQAQKMEAVGQLAGGIAHDFNNLLTVILGRGYLLRNRAKKGALARDLDLIMTTASRAAALTKQLLAFSRKQVLQPKVLDLNGIVAGMGVMLRRLIGEHIDLVTVLEPQVHRVNADPTQLEQIIVNLAVNARDAMPRGGRLTIETTNVVLDGAFQDRHPDSRPGPHALIAVSDTGCGMDADVQSHIFEPFFTTKAPGQGTGLGLATVYGIVKQHDGYVTVSSTPGEGTTFNIYLPQAVGAVRSKETMARRDVRRGSETILLVEDEEEVRRLASDVLRTTGYDVVEAATPLQALSHLEQHPLDVDLLLTDVVMPEMSGAALAERLRVERPMLPVLYMSGYTRDTILHHGVTDIDPVLLQKPFLPDDLARKVREVLDAARERLGSDDALALVRS
jgi:PAS domain S-box-containing protein